MALDKSYKFLDLSSNCQFVDYEWENSPYPVAIKYVERSPDQWHFNSETTVDIDVDMAREIVSFLENAFKRKLSSYKYVPSHQEIAECGGPCETIGPEACDCHS